MRGRDPTGRPEGDLSPPPLFSDQELSLHLHPNLKSCSAPPPRSEGPFLRLLPDSMAPRAPGGAGRLGGAVNNDYFCYSCKAVIFNRLVLHTYPSPWVHRAMSRGALGCHNSGEECPGHLLGKGRLCTMTSMGPTQPHHDEPLLP
uniref:Uncharacterized protein n=1 Tax=Myotis myotis TaxID=51298 RepID=A0A7J7QTU8_MYOMY|nr:hypothetical protein mMyoMyo1_011829 [Myotis myotis]